MKPKRPAQWREVVAKAWTDPAYANAEGGCDRGHAASATPAAGRTHGGAVQHAEPPTWWSAPCAPVTRGGACLPPVWYNPAYRSRAVIDPRGVLAEFGVKLPEKTKVSVWDSTAEIRYLVIPRRPANTESLSEEDLAGLVNRDSMIGTRLAGKAA